MIRILAELLLTHSPAGDAAGPIEYALMALIAVALLLVAAALILRPAPTTPHRLTHSSAAAPARRRSPDSLLTGCVIVLALWIAVHGVWPAMAAFVLLAAYTVALRIVPTLTRPRNTTAHDCQGTEDCDLTGARR